MCSSTNKDKTLQVWRISGDYIFWPLRDRHQIELELFPHPFHFASFCWYVLETSSESEAMTSLRTEKKKIMENSGTDK